MKKQNLLSMRLLSLLLTISLGMIACYDSDSSSTDEEPNPSAGTEEAGTEDGGTETGGTEDGGTETGGTEDGGTETGGTDNGGTDNGGSEIGGTEMSGAAEMMMEEPFVCAQDPLQIQRASVRPSPNFIYLGIDDRFNFNNILQVEFTNDPVQGEIYSVEGQTPADCNTCVYIGLQCTEDGCTDVYFASAGELTFSELGASGQELSLDITSLTFSKMNRDDGSLDTTSQTCMADQSFRAMRPTEVGDVIPDSFEVQNCETGDMVNVKEFGANAAGIWYFATAGWCPACRETLNYLYAEVFPDFTPESIRPMIVVSEDDQGEPATLAFCRSYAARYTDSAVDFYVDASLDNTFGNVWAYFGDDGSFGLPWQAMFEGGTGVYLYADGAPGPDTLEDVLNRLLAP